LSDNQPYPSIISVLEVFDTGDRPIKILADDGNAYLIKHTILEGMQSKLVREWICYQLFQHLNVSIPKATLLSFEPLQFQNELKPLIGRFADQVVFASQWLHARDIKDDFYSGISRRKESLRNPLELAKILVMDIWLKNNDRQPSNLNLIISKRKIYAIDHAATFDQEPFSRLADSTRKEYFVEPGEKGDLMVSSDFFNYYFRQHATEFEESGNQLCEKIELLDTTFLKSITDSIPAIWHIQEDEKAAIIEYLYDRKSKISDRFTGHLNFGR
jgi:hypothetical protein